MVGNSTPMFDRAWYTVIPFQDTLLPGKRFESMGMRFGLVVESFISFIESLERRHSNAWYIYLH